MPKRINIKQYQAEKRESTGIIFEAEDGTEFEIPPSVCWPDEMADAARAGDAVAQCKILLGTRYDEFIAKGGTSVMLNKVIEETLGAKSGESSAS